MATHTNTDVETNSSPEPATPDTKTLALIASPGYCERVAADLEDSLPEYLASEIEDDVEWHIEVVTDPLTGANVDLSAVLDEAAKRAEASPSWDHAICLTDLPVRSGDKIVIARADAERDVGVISLPPLGVFRILGHVRAAILQVLQHLWRRSTDDEDAWRKIGYKVAKSEILDQDDGQHVIEYSAPGRIAYLKLLAGMVYANRPWRLLPSFKKTISAAFATGGYAMIFTTVWEIANLYGMLRLVFLMLLAMTILTGWIIVAHGLWEPKIDEGSRYLWSLYNTTTLVTVVSGVVFSYLIIFALLFVASFFFIPTALLEETIGTQVNAVSYLRVSWAGASVATVVGAIGAGLEDSDAVRNATFGWRQHNRWVLHNQEVKEEGA